ncbi:acyclic terpene utilization AtuA family protein [Dactylosporangium sp. CA-092794]|uniref:acyclic terpene utilization AtuA family protein n=1 Tax=Dactylosporangium sp. CA-092794 TaxID=3239929 RepID=UPI003D927097
MVLRIGNASGFYGDRATAWREMLDGGELDVLTGDYLAELTMLILGRDRLKDPATGYAKTFLRQLESVLGTALERGVRLVTNAGGLNPAGLAEAIRALATRLGLAPAVAHVEGDDLTGRAGELGLGAPLTANAYLGAFGIAECLAAGADIVVTGRVTDASLVVGPGIARFGWTRDDLDALAGATVAGHVLECGAQATGGNFAFFTELPDGARRPGFPLAELHADGSAVITKHPGTGGAVTVETVTAQLLYEIGAPAYAGPDVVADFASIALSPDGPDRVRIGGVRGLPPPPTLKVGVNALGGFRNAMTFVLCGLQIERKAELVRAQLVEALGPDGLEFALARTDRPDAADEFSASALLTVHIKDRDARRAGRTFSQAAVELALASYPGLALTAPPGDATPFGVFTSHFVPQDAAFQLAVLPDGTQRAIDAPVTTNLVKCPKNQDTPVSGFFGPERKRAPLGTLFGARSGDKGGDANIGVWARTDRAYEWLRTELTGERLKELLPETAPLPVERYELANLRAVNFVIHGILGEGVAASTRFDPQGKALGEWLRSRVVDLPAELLP